MSKTKSKIKLLAENAARIAHRPDKISWSDNRGALSQFSDLPKYAPDKMIIRTLKGPKFYQVKLNPSRKIRRYVAKCVIKYHELFDAGKEMAAETFGKKTGIISRTGEIAYV